MRVSLPWVMKPEVGPSDNGVAFGGWVFRQIRGVQRKLLFAFALFPVPRAKNNQYIKVTYLGVALTSSGHILGWRNLLPFTYKAYDLNTCLPFCV